MWPFLVSVQYRTKRRLDVTFPLIVVAQALDESCLNLTPKAMVCVRGFPLAAVFPQLLLTGPLKGRQATHLAVPMAGIRGEPLAARGYTPRSAPPGHQSCGALAWGQAFMCPGVGCSGPLVPHSRPLHKLVVVRAVPGHDQHPGDDKLMPDMDCR